MKYHDYCVMTDRGPSLVDGAEPCVLPSHPEIRAFVHRSWHDNTFFEVSEFESGYSLTKKASFPWRKTAIARADALCSRQTAEYLRTEIDRAVKEHGRANDEEDWNAP